jgi:hypothetical protein
MKKLNEILRQMGPQFPIQGVDGYGGEQNGSTVVFLGTLSFSSREEAKKIELGDAIGIHWAEYRAGRGWQVSLAHWSDQAPEDCYIHLNDADARWQ